MWDEQSSRYKGVFIYAIVESLNYYRVKRTPGRGWSGGWDINGVATYDEEPTLKGWNVFGADGRIDYPYMDIEQFPNLRSVEKFIDFKLKEIEYHG